MAISINAIIAFEFIFLVFMIFLLIWVLWTKLKGGAGYGFTPGWNVRKSFELACLSKEDVFYDLGCGLGDILKMAEKRAKKVVGIEVDPLRALISRIRARHSIVINEDMFKADISDADVVFIYHNYPSSQRLAAKFRNELKKGARVVSYRWKIEGMDIIAESDNIYLYKI